jgi:hypothetical protein
VVAVVLEETKDVIGDDGPGRLRREAADTEALRGGVPGARLDDSSVRVAEDCCPGVCCLVVYDSPVLLFQALRPAVVVVIEEGNERTIRPREQGIARRGHPTVGAVTNQAHRSVPLRELL